LPEADSTVDKQGKVDRAAQKVPDHKNRSQVLGRDGRRELHFFHGDHAIDHGEIQLVDHPFVDRVIGGHVGDHDLQNIVDCAGQAVGLDDFGDLVDQGPEAVYPVLFVARRADADEDRNDIVAELSLDSLYRF